MLLRNLYWQRLHELLTVIIQQNYRCYLLLIIEFELNNKIKKNPFRKPIGLLSLQKKPICLHF